MNTLTQERAEEIALALIKYQYAKHGVDVSSKMRDDITALVVHWRIEAEAAKRFFAHLIIPAQAKEIFGWASMGHTGQCDNAEAKKVAYALVQQHATLAGVHLGKQFSANLRKISKDTGVPFDELGLFFATHYLPISVNKFVGMEGWQISPGHQEDPPIREDQSHG